MLYNGVLVSATKQCKLLIIIYIYISLLSLYIYIYTYMYIHIHTYMHIYISPFAKSTEGLTGDECSYFPARIPKLYVAAEHILTGKCWILPKKDTSHSRARRSLSKMVEGATSPLESSPIPARDDQRAQKNPCVHQDFPQRLNQTCL